jgi:HD-GYP domain-containing protein (c-di-GMP phosphodiesterase class II)
VAEPGANRPADAPGEGHRERLLGATILSRLHAVLRGIRLYAASNRALRAQQQELLDAIMALMEDEISLLGMGEYFYVNGVRLRPDGAQVAVFRTLLGEFEVRELGGLRFAVGLTIEELDAFLRVFHSLKSRPGAAVLEAELAAAGVRHVSPIRVKDVVVPQEEDAEGGAADGEKRRARMVHRKAVQGTRDVLQRTARTGRPALQQARRVVQPIVDQLLKSADSLVGMTALKQHDEYTYVHCVNVSIVSVRIGQQLGLKRSELANIGVAALLHDTGKIAIPLEVLLKPGQLDDREWQSIRRHPIEGVRIVSRLPGISDLMVDSMRVAFEHHMHVDHSGYPRVREARPLGAFSRIVAVADIFDAVTSHRAYRKRPMTAHEALRLLLGREREHFDPAVLGALVQTVGLYPAGTVFVTDAGRIMLSVGPNSADPRRPICRELAGDVHEETAEIQAEGTDTPLPPEERVVHVIPPEEFYVDVEGLLAA